MKQMVAAAAAALAAVLVAPVAALSSHHHHHAHGEGARAQRLRSSSRLASSAPAVALHAKRHLRSTSRRGIPKPPPGPPPLGELYDDAGEVATYIEQRPVDFFTEGARPDIDIPASQERDMRRAFEETPDIFRHCVLVREFATPLRVGSSLKVLAATRTMNGTSRASGGDDGDGDSTSDSDDADNIGASGDGKAQAKKAPPADDDGGDSGSDSGDSGGDDADRSGSAAKPPGDELLAKGGVANIGEDGKAAALMEVDMVAWLASVAGHVSVIPKGLVAKWGSKRKVPIAGYLCTDSGEPVLHTLPTPCVATSLNDEGQENGPPPPEQQAERIESEGDAIESDAGASGAAPAPAVAANIDAGASAGALGNATAPPTTSAPVAAAPSPAAAKMDFAAAAKMAPSPAGAASFLQGHHHRHHLRSSRKPPASPTQRSAQRPFAVWVGSTKLHFSSKGRAERFCHRLAQKIAEDPGDNEWDTDKLKDMAAATTDMKVSTLVQVARKDKPEAWTTGTKKLLVVVMDWMSGDRSKAPLSSQSTTPEHYDKVVMPRVKRAFSEMSFGKFEIDFEVVPEIVRYTQPRNRLAAKGGWPFPALYNGATQALEGHPKFSQRYDPAKYDLVYTVSPQQAPVGTKGVAWVGAKGAMCNGCEAISDNFQVMVAVHELGHNLGLSHAGSKSLEYGNPFDWMGNYPDVEGLSYGMGYKLKLHWLPRNAVARITDKNLDALNERYIIAPFDSSSPKQADVVGLQLSLRDNPRDLFVSFRKTTGREAGVYLVMQDKDKPDSELVDMGCHTPSQKDARLQSGWTYVDPSSQVVIKVDSITDGAATLHVYRAPGAEDLRAIRARETYSDGAFKCPRTCTDSDLLVANFNGCAALSSEGYCKSGQITMGGKKFSVKEDLCPSSCGECAAVLSGPQVVGAGGAGGCADRDVKINGMQCPTIAAKGHCSASTNIGHVGRDLCPQSCGNCPQKPSFGGSVGSYADPVPARTIGGGGTQSAKASPAAGDGADKGEEAEDDAEEEDEQEEEPECADDREWQDTDGDSCSIYKEFIAEGKLSREQACRFGEGAAMRHCRETCGVCGAGSTPLAPGGGCEDDAEWADKDGDDCRAYAEYVKQGHMTQREACQYDGGLAATKCRKTCNSCVASITDSAGDAACKDQSCVTQWLQQTGQCFACADWPSRCNETNFRMDCPLTCGLCPHAAQISKGHDSAAVDDEEVRCEDSDCIEHWRSSTDGVCYKCSDFADDYCGTDRAFMEACPKSCKLCRSGAAAGCADDYSATACREYKGMGWCPEATISRHCKDTCGKCDEDRKPYLEEAPEPMPERAPRPSPTHSAARRVGSFAAAVLAAPAALLLAW